MLFKTLLRTPVLRHAEENQADLYFIQDFQLAPLAALFPWMRPALWMCHVDTANPDPRGNAYIEQYLDAYAVCVFNTPISVFKDLPPEKAHVIKHAQVNAFQRYSSVILQRSTREGFGLTVTEAMWKYQPVVGTSVTGLRTQIIDGRNGFIVDDTETCAKVTLKLIEDRDLWHKLGKQGHLRVKNNYLLPVMILEYLDALTKARGMSHITGEVQAALESTSSSQIQT